MCAWLGRRSAYLRAMHSSVEPKLTYCASPCSVDTRCRRTIARNASYSVDGIENRLIPRIRGEPLSHLLGFDGTRLPGQVAVEQRKEFRVGMLHAPMTRWGLLYPQDQR